MCVCAFFFKQKPLCLENETVFPLTPNSIDKTHDFSSTGHGNVVPSVSIVPLNDSNHSLHSFLCYICTTTMIQQVDYVSSCAVGGLFGWFLILISAVTFSVLC